MQVKTPQGKATIFFDAMTTPKNKKYSVYTPTNRLIHFGDRSYPQYKDQALGKYKKLDHNDPVRRKRYRKRHIGDNYNDPEYPSYYSWNYLW
jgi:hypothetical protein